MKRPLPKPQIAGDSNRTVLKRTAVLMALFGVAVFIPLLWRLVSLQIVQYDTLSQLAADNQTRISKVTPARGTVYDRNMNVLAMSADVENVCIDPNELGLSGQDLDAIADKLSSLLNVSAEKIRTLMEDTSYRYQIVKRKVEQEEAASVRAYLSEETITGVYLEPDTRRYYPYGTLAAQVLGFVGSDNTGLDGIEAAENQTLTGLGGSIATAKGNYGTQMQFHFEQYADSVNGCDVVLTIDQTVQEMLEKHMQEAITQYDVQNGAFGVVMDVNSGDILAMATLGSYDPNNYAVIYDTKTAEELEDQYQAAMEESGELQEQLLSAYNTAVANARLAQWRNRVISDGYEPGSTFKSITLASALEEGAVSLSDSFYCSGSTTIKGRTKALHCWRSAGHGQQSTAEALQNSCNVAFANIGIRLGGEKLYEYVHKFGLTEKTGIELGGEASGIFFDEATLANPDSYASLSSAAFGQTFKITPLQLVRAIAAVVNGGYVLEPHVVHQVLSPEGEVLETKGRTVLRQVISRETSETMCQLLESVVSQGTAKNAQIAGYRIGGKTGTSEKIDVFDEEGNPVQDKIVSFVGIAPMDHPQYISGGAGYPVPGNRLLYFRRTDGRAHGTKCAGGYSSVSGHSAGLYRGGGTAGGCVHAGADGPEPQRCKGPAQREKSDLPDGGHRRNGHGAGSRRRSRDSGRQRNGAVSGSAAGGHGHFGAGRRRKGRGNCQQPPHRCGTLYEDHWRSGRSEHDFGHPAVSRSRRDRGTGHCGGGGILRSQRPRLKR